MRRRWVARRPVRPVMRGLAGLLALLVVAAGAITVGLRLAPMQTVPVAGQVFTVGAIGPDWRLSGPGEIDLFGQSLPTHMRFPGPVRPRLALTRITINSELANFVHSTTPAEAQRRIGGALAGGWTRYFSWETAITGVTALVLLGAVAGWRRLPGRTTVILLAVGLAVTEGINIGAIMLTAYQVPHELRQVRSLSQLVGDTAPPPGSARSQTSRPQVSAIVLGDSTAAGAGLPPVGGASPLDHRCGRSADSYAADLATVNDWQVLNLACDSATIHHGLLGPQLRHGQTVPAQVATAQQAGPASVVIVSVGADDLDWSAMVVYCAVAPRCNDRATAAYFQQRLAAFSKAYLDLLTRLSLLPGHPRVVVNQYYDPFGPRDCLSQAGLTPGKIRTLTSRLETLNTVLARGATRFGFGTARPDFSGHQLCSGQPYVQGLGAPAPFHPTAAGQLAIALADQAALRTTGPVPAAEPGPAGQTIQDRLHASPFRISR